VPQQAWKQLLPPAWRPAAERLSSGANSGVVHVETNV
jgi:hypothetical protein